MVFQEFVENTICQMAPSSFELTKEILLGEKLVAFSVIKPNKAGIDASAEKVCDYFETFEIKANRTFGKQLEAYMNELDAIVAPRIGRAAQPKKGDNTPPVTPRARKYYEKYLAYKTCKEITITQLLDFTRIMMSLYTGSIINEGKPIENFDYSAKCLDVNKILENLKKEETFIIIPQNKKKRFEFREKYGIDTCIYVMVVIALCSVVNEKK